MRGLEMQGRKNISLCQCTAREVMDVFPDFGNPKRIGFFCYSVLARIEYFFVTAISKPFSNPAKEETIMASLP